MPTWAIILIAISIVLVVGVLLYVVFRWGPNKAAVTKASLAGASAVFSVLQGVFKDKPDELDAHDFMVAFESLSNAGQDAIREQEQGLPFVELKDNMKSRVKEIVDSFPQLKDKVTDDLIVKAVDAFFMVIDYIPKVKDIAKKSEEGDGVS